MANSLAWSTLSQKQLEDYYSSPLEATSILSKITTSPILIDLYTYILRYSASQNHSPIQTSTLFSIVQKTHEKCVQSPVLNFESDYDYFKKLMLSHSIYRPPYSVRVFTLNQVRDITEFVTRTYFRCYGMYKYVFTKRMLMDLSIGVVEESVPEVVQVLEDVPPVVEIEQEAPIIPIEEVKALEEIIDTTPKIEPIVQQEVAQESPLIQASVDLKSFITTTLAAKIEELRIQMTTKLAQQEENVLSQLKKLEDVKAGKKDVAPKKK